MLFDLTSMCICCSQQWTRLLWTTFDAGTPFVVLVEMRLARHTDLCQHFLYTPRTITPLAESFRPATIIIILHVFPCFSAMQLVLSGHEQHVYNQHGIVFLIGKWRVQSYKKGNTSKPDDKCCRTKGLPKRCNCFQSTSESHWEIRISGKLRYLQWLSSPYFFHVHAGTGEMANYLKHSFKCNAKSCLKRLHILIMQTW